MECELCCEDYNDSDRAPYVSKCGHTFCRACINKVIRRRLFECPNCRKVCKSKECVKNFWVIQNLGALMQQRQVLGEADVSGAEPSKRRRLDDVHVQQVREVQEEQEEDVEEEEEEEQEQEEQDEEEEQEQEEQEEEEEEEEDIFEDVIFAGPHEDADLALASYQQPEWASCTFCGRLVSGGESGMRQHQEASLTCRAVQQSEVHLSSLGEDLPELPPGWAVAWDTSCGRRRPYFYNSVTGESQWDPPPILPPGWLQHKDPTSGNIYYYNRATQQSSWDVPLHLPAGWEQWMLSNGTAYFHNRSTGQTLWNPPL